MLIGISSGLHRTPVHCTLAIQRMAECGMRPLRRGRRLISRRRIGPPGVTGRTFPVPATGENAKPGDKWQIEFGKADSSKTVTCGQPEEMYLPADDTAPGKYIAICCATAPSDTNDDDSYSACFTAGIGLVSETYPKAKSEIITYSIARQQAGGTQQK